MVTLEKCIKCDKPMSSDLLACPHCRFSKLFCHVCGNQIKHDSPKSEIIDKTRASSSGKKVLFHDDCYMQITSLDKELVKYSGNCNLCGERIGTIYSLSDYFRYESSFYLPDSISYTSSCPHCGFHSSNSSDKKIGFSSLKRLESEKKFYKCYFCYHSFNLASGILFGLRNDVLGAHKSCFTPERKKLIEKQRQEEKIAEDRDKANKRQKEQEEEKKKAHAKRVEDNKTIAFCITAAIVIVVAGLAGSMSGYPPVGFLFLILGIMASPFIFFFIVMLLPT